MILPALEPFPSCLRVVEFMPLALPELMVVFLIMESRFLLLVPWIMAPW